MQDSTSDTLDQIPENADDFLSKLERLIDLQYTFLKRSYGRSKGGSLPEHSWSAVDLDRMLLPIFERELTEDERETVIWSLGQHFEVIRDLCSRKRKFPEYEASWDSFRARLQNNEADAEEEAS